MQVLHYKETQIGGKREQKPHCTMNLHFVLHMCTGSGHSEVKSNLYALGLFKKF